MGFTDLNTYKKGKRGEELIRDFLHSKGWVTYSPDNINTPHCFDLIAIKNKEKIIAIDVKTKARFNKWAAQGINKKHYNEYLKFTQTSGIKFYLIFVDDKNGDIHCADLINLKNPFYPGNDIIAWGLDQMVKIGKIQDDNILFELSQYDNRSYTYDPIPEQLTLFNDLNLYQGVGGV